MKYFARLYNNHEGMFNLMRFESPEYLASYYADNTADYEFTGEGLCWAEIEKYDKEKHDNYFAHIDKKEFEIILL